MEFVLSLVSDEQRLLQQRADALCRGELGARERLVGETDTVDREALRCLARAGLLDWAVPGAYGTGNSRDLAAPTDLSLASFCLIRETLARHCPNAELIFTMQGLGAGPISFAGSEAQRKKYLPRVASGELVAAFALTEPHAGSDVAALDLVARRDGGVYVLDGRKAFISMAPDADLYTVFARTIPDAGAKGISVFIVEKGTAGFDPGERVALLAAHPIAHPVFSGCRIPVENRIGEENAGFAIAMSTLDFFRTTVGACAVGFAQRALDASLEYASARRAFGKPIAEFQLIQSKLATMATELAAARLLVYRAALMRDRGVRARLSLEGSQAKLFATEAAQRIVDQAVQIHGGQGVVRGSDVERLYREVRALRIYEGTSEIQHLVIANQLLRRHASAVARPSES
jgi:acyl-CoA dehydrogenase